MSCSKTIGVIIFMLVMLTLGGCSPQNKAVNGGKGEYPAKPITLIVPFTAGGMTDIVSRSMEKTAVKYFKQPIVIVNKPGGAGTIGWNEVVAARPDGYTIGMATPGIVLQPLYGKGKYNYPTALEPIGQIANMPFIMSVMPNSKFTNLAEFVRYAKEHPGEIKYGHNGLGSSPQVFAEMFAHAAGIKLEQVPFQGSSETMAALLGGHIDVAFNGVPEMREYAKSKKVLVLGITSNRRINDAYFGDVPTFIEQGYNVALSNFHCIVVPKEMPSDIKDKLTVGISEIFNDPEFLATMQQFGATAEYLGPEECVKKWAQENELYTKAIHETGIYEQVAARGK